jgi:hypothetical protein
MEIQVRRSRASSGRRPLDTERPAVAEAKLQIVPPR